MLAVDNDTNAFNAYMDARRLPKNSAEESKIREKAIQDGLKQAVMVPWNTAQLSFEALKIAKRVVELGNVNSVSDAGVGAQIAFTGVRGGIYNVIINLPQITDKKYVDQMKEEANKLENEAEKILRETIEKTRKVIESM